MNKDLDIKQFRKKKNLLGASTILMLAFVLVAITLLVFEMNRRIPKPDKDIKDIAGSERIGIADSVYFNRPYYFTLKRVVDDWDMQVLTMDSVLQFVDTDRSLFDQINWVFEMDHVVNSDTLATSLTGILKWQDEQPDSKDLAISLLAEIFEKYETSKERANLLVPTTLPAHHVLVGYYWAVVLPEKRVEKNVWVLSVMPRRNVTYIVLNRTNQDRYDNYKSVFQKINHGFRTLSMLDKDVDYTF